MSKLTGVAGALQYRTIVFPAIEGARRYVVPRYCRLSVFYVQTTDHIPGRLGNELLQLLLGRCY